MQHWDESTQFRRIQLSGGSTYILSLPKKWIEELKIKAGDSLAVVKNSNESLSIYPRERKDDKKTTAIIKSSQKDSGEAIKRKIIAMYLGGYNTIQIKTKGMKIPSEHTKSIRSLVRSSMVGTEIIESSSDVITIQILTKLPELSFETSLNRMFLMAKNMIKEAMDSLEDLDLEHANEVVNMDDEVDRFSLYIRRNLVLAVRSPMVLKEMGLRTSSDCLGYRTVTSRIERSADHASLIAKRVKFVEGKIEHKNFEKLRKLSEKSLCVFEESISAVQSHDFEKAERVAEKVGNIINEEKKIMDKIRDDTKNSTIIRFILEDLRRIAEYSSDIAEVAIDENIYSIISEK